MNTLPINNNTNFKSVYPTMHWVTESNGSYAPVAVGELTRKLQRKIVSALNKGLDKSKKPLNLQEQKLRAYIGSCDADYRCMPLVRSFYDKVMGGMSYKPTTYIISGKDIEPFEEAMTKNIGIAKSDAKKEIGHTKSVAAMQAVDFYNRNGYGYVNNPELRITNETGMPLVLHTKFEIVRNKFGKIKDYRFIDARFLPEKGSGNPLERLKYQK